MRGVNDDELVALVEFGRGIGAEVRFIEYMDVGGATRWSPERGGARAARSSAALAAALGAIEPLPPERRSAPAERFRLPDGTVFGIIASTTAPFCRACDRGRLTADGVWYLCLYAARGARSARAAARRRDARGAAPADRRAPGASRDDRGAEERLAERDRGAARAADALRRDPHLEMHTRGG